MRGEYDRLRQLLLQPESERLDALDGSLRRAHARFEDIPDALAADIEQSLRQGSSSRFSEALAEATTGSLEIAVRRRPQSVVEAVYPVIGPAIRRSLGEALRHMADDLDRALYDTLSLRALWWRLESWRTGTPYAQVVLRHTTSYQVEYLYLIEPTTGLLLGHLAGGGLPELDADAVAGMFTAIHQFVRDSVSAGGSEGGIGSATVGDYRLVVSEGPHARLVAFVRGLPSADFKGRLDELNEELHARHGSRLSAPDVVGQAGHGFLEPLQLDDLNARGSHTVRTERLRSLQVLMAAAVLALLVYGGFGVWWAQQSAEIREHVSTLPGVVISKWDDDGGRLRVEGLMDPLATDPRAWLAKEHPGVKAEWQMQPFVSLDPRIVRRRVAHQLRLPERMVDYSDGVARLEGTVPFGDWDRAARVSAATLPGVERVDVTALEYPGRKHIEALIEDLQGAQVQFDSGTDRPSAGMEDVIARMNRQLHELQELGAGNGIAFRMRTLGFTDEPGSYVQNRDLRQRRAEWLATRLLANLRPPSTVTVDQDVIYTLPNATVRATSVVITPFPARQPSP